MRSGRMRCLQRLPGASVRFVGHRAGEVRTDNGFLGLTVDAPFDASHRSGHRRDSRWHRDSRPRSRRGHPQLDSRRPRQRASTRRLFAPARFSLPQRDCSTVSTRRRTLQRSPCSAKYGAKPTNQRVVEQGKIITAAGVSSGIDMALRLAERVATDETTAKALQLMIEYDPQPPHDAGALHKVDPTVDCPRAGAVPKDKN